MQSYVSLSFNTLISQIPWAQSPKEPSNYQEWLSGHEKHVPIPSETDHDALSKPKGNAVKDQHRNDRQPSPRLFCQYT